jgi:hypothetical protein
VTDHLAGFLGGTLLGRLDQLGLDLVPRSFDGDDKGVTFVVEGRAGTRVRVTVSIESVDDLDG